MIKLYGYNNIIHIAVNKFITHLTIIVTHMSLWLCAGFAIVKYKISINYRIAGGYPSRIITSY